MSTLETKFEAAPPTKIATASGRIIAVAIVIACINFASSIIITLICAILIAFVLEPAVRFLERIHIPRWVGALIMLVGSIGLLYLVRSEEHTSELQSHVNLVC